MEHEILLPDLVVASRIQWIRWENVMLAHVRAKPSGVSTFPLNEAMGQLIKRAAGGRKRLGYRGVDPV